MKKLILTLALMISMTISTSAMSSQQARSIALFLTDKMAYELDLTRDQYNASYEINYDYLLRLCNSKDLYGTYWSRRNTDMRYILGSSKFLIFQNANYFYRPVYWYRNRFDYRIYSRYPDRKKNYYSRPDNANKYNGNHSWKANNNRSYYMDKTFNNGNGMRSEMNNKNQSIDRNNMNGHNNNLKNDKGNNNRDKYNSTNKRMNMGNH